ncbi:unnamed protein product [Closterium sp. NIES-54]
MVASARAIASNRCLPLAPSPATQSPTDSSPKAPSSAAPPLLVYPPSHCCWCTKGGEGGEGREDLSGGITLVAVVAALPPPPGPDFFPSVAFPARACFCSAGRWQVGGRWQGSGARALPVSLPAPAPVGGRMMRWRIMEQQWGGGDLQHQPPAPPPPPPPPPPPSPPSPCCGCSSGGAGMGVAGVSKLLPHLLLSLPLLHMPLGGGGVGEIREWW